MEVPFKSITLSMFPPRSPFGYVLLKRATECNGWCMSPAKWIRYLANKALYALLLYLFRLIIFLANTTTLIELESTIV